MHATVAARGVEFEALDTELPFECVGRVLQTKPHGPPGPVVDQLRISIAFFTRRTPLTS
jgi:hypothetical protein